MICINRAAEPIPPGQVNLLYTLRSLWRDLATWLSAYMVAQVDKNGTADKLFTRLYEIPAEFGNIIQFFFGYNNAQVFVQMLSQHIVILKSLIDAEISGDVNSVNHFRQQLYLNADQRAGFYTSINPFWDETEARNLIYTFDGLIIDEIIALLSRDIEKGIDIYDRLLHHTDQMGNFFAAGLENYLTYRTDDTQTNQPANQTNF